MIDREALVELLRAASAQGLTPEETAARIVALHQRPNSPVKLLNLSGADRLRLPALIASKTRQEGECLVWTGRTGRGGYGVISVLGDFGPTSTSAHRAAWILANGAITDPKLVLDHLCRNRACVRVEHLEPVTQRENLLRGNLKKTHCKRGHLLSGEDVRLYQNPRTGYLDRVCLKCRRQYRRDHQTTSASAGK